MKKSFIILILILVLAILLVSLAVLIILKHGAEKLYQNLPKIEKPAIPENIEDFLVKEEYINYILYAISANKLHSPLFSSNKPIIKFEIDSEVFISEVDSGLITTKKGNYAEEDLKFITSKQEIVNAINSENIKDYFLESINSGKSSYEIKASNTELFAKGYLSLYTELTGEKVSISGSIIKRIFNKINP